MKTFGRAAGLVCILSAFAMTGAAQAQLLPKQTPSYTPENFRRTQLVAWCIVPFDAKQRSPAERAEMVQHLGLTRVAYDWRKEHVPSFESEIVEYKKRGIEFFAFWGWHDAIAPLIRKHQVAPQIWQTVPSPDAPTQKEKVEAAAEAIRPLVDKARDHNLTVGLYNHGGWGGEPTNLVDVCEHLRRVHKTDQIGIVYNFHHGHQDIDGFATSLRQIKPYLLCLNLNGMMSPTSVKESTGENKIVTIGEGEYEKGMIKAVIESGYRGPIGVIGHRADADVAEVLQANIEGLESLLAE